METIMSYNLNLLKGATSLKEYEHAVPKTDRFSVEDTNPILLGLFGEVGSIMATSKKYRREKRAYPTYKDAAEEEFGDALWYFSALCRRVNVGLVEVFDAACNELEIKSSQANDQANRGNSSNVDSSLQAEKLDFALIELGSMAAQLLKVTNHSISMHHELVLFAQQYLQAIDATGLSFADVLTGNLRKTLGRFSRPERDSLPDFDETFPEEEQLPRHFEIHFTQRSSGQCYLRWNDVFIGSPLTDNIRDPDGYRFHDVFHLAHAAVLHWSPTFRALIKQKRKSDPGFDEAQDGGRAIVVEEGLTAWLYSYAKGLEYFEGHDGISFDALKTIQKFVQGYEVEKCPLKLWEDAILQGYSVFRKVRRNNGGIVIGDRESRTISYRPIGE